MKRLVKCDMTLELEPEDIEVVFDQLYDILVENNGMLSQYRYYVQEYAEEEQRS